ncbi:MAG: RecX family transcriptional regulator [Pyrinomonadaceae bacterium]|nr:RecX family transcriptional regulator [Pyrinomonadaceae bacterium]
MRYKRPIKDEDRVIKDPERSRKKTFDRAVNLLTYKPRSIEEIRTRLLEKAWTNEEIVDGVIEKLKEYNYLNDEQYAASFASSKIRGKPIGKRRLAQDLKKKKIDPETIEKALDSAYDETPESELIERAIEKRLRIKGPPQTYNERQNFFGYLVRLGFEYDLIRQKLEALPKNES